MKLRRDQRRLTSFDSKDFLIVKKFTQDLWHACHISKINRAVNGRDKDYYIMYEHYKSGRYFEGRMFNYSRGGMYLESNHAPETGAEIFIAE